MSEPNALVVGFYTVAFVDEIGQYPSLDMMVHIAVDSANQNKR